MSFTETMEYKTVGTLNILEKDQVFNEVIQKELNYFACLSESLGISRDVIEKMLIELRKNGSDASKNVKICSFVYETMDYDRFKFIDGNRRINRTNLRNIIKSFGEQGQQYVMNPIIINEKMEIIDGQHRFEASRALGMPIQYIIVYGAGRQAVQNMNEAKANWSIADFVGFHSVTDESFDRLFDLLKDFNEVSGDEKLTTTVIYAAVFKRPASSANQAIKSAAAEGHLNFSEEECMFVRGYLNSIQILKKENAALLKRVTHADKLLNAIYRLMSVDGLSYERFKKGFEWIKTYDLSHEKECYQFVTNNFENCLRTAYDIYKLGKGRYKILEEEDLARINKECHPVVRRKSKAKA